MLELRNLTLQLLVLREVCYVADVVMRADEGEMIRLLEERPDGLDFPAFRNLNRPDRVETDDDERVNAAEKTRIKRA